MITTFYTGTAREQWALAAIDVALGRITAAEVVELGERLFREAEGEDSEEVRRLKREIFGLEDELRDAQDEYDEAAKEARELKQRIRELEANQR